jgi:hypothetical protein
MYIGVIGGFVIIQANIIDLARLGFWFRLKGWMHRALGHCPWALLLFIY